MSEELAGENGQVAAGTENSQVNTEEPQVNGNQVDQVQPDEQQPAAEPDQEVAFHKRLSQEKEKLERQYTEQYSPYKGFIEKEAQKYGMTPQDYIAAIDAQEKEQEREALLEKGIDPDYLNEAISKHPAVQEAERIMQERQIQAQFNSEAQELFEEFPDINVKEIPETVFDLRNEKGLSLLDAYLRVTYKKNRTLAEQDAIKGIKNGMDSTPGGLADNAAQPKTGYAAMSADEKRAFREKVKRGEVTELPI